MDTIIRKFLHFLEAPSGQGYVYWSGTGGDFSLQDVLDGSNDVLCGDGSDGTLVFNGVDAVTGCSLDTGGAHPIYTMTQNLNANNITVSNTVEIKTDSYIFKVLYDATFGTDCIVSNDGTASTNHSSVANSTTHYYSSRKGSGIGRNATAGAGGNGTAFTSHRLGAAGGSGGTAGGANTGGSAGNPNNGVFADANGEKFLSAILGYCRDGTAVNLVCGGSGGGGGGNSGASSSSTAGGQGGGMLAFLVGGTLSWGTGCSVTAKGGNSADASGTAGNAGTGGGGGGGVVIVRSLRRSTQAPTISAAGGTGGTPFGTGVQGSTGSTGYSVELYTSLV